MTIKTVSAAQLSGMLGANTHCNWNTAGWLTPSMVLACLQYTNIKCIRDAPPYEQAISDEYDMLFKDNVVTVNAVVGTPTGQSELAELRSLVQQYPGALVSIEGVNETTAAAASANADQATLYQSVKSDSVLGHIPVLAYSLQGGQDYVPFGNQSTHADIANGHFYANSDPNYNGGVGGIPEPNMLSGMTSVAQASPSLPLYVTEWGWTLGTDEGWGLATDANRAIYTLRGWFYLALMGVQKTFIYSLIDNASDAGTVGEDGFGLFDYQGNPRAAATAIKNVMAILADAGTVPVITQSAASITGVTYELAVQKSDGTLLLIVWNSNGTTQASLALPYSYASLTLHDPIDGTATVTTNASGMKLTVPNYPIIVEVSAALASQAAPPVVTPISPVVTSMTSANGVSVTAPGRTFTDATGRVWGLQASTSQGNQITVNGVVDTTTAMVTRLTWLNGNVFQTNQAGGGWVKTKGAGSWVAVDASVVKLTLTPAA